METRLEKFLKENTPSFVVFPLQTLERVVEEAGFSMRLRCAPSYSDEIYMYRVEMEKDGLEHIDLRVDDVMLCYSPSIEGSEVVYKPYITKILGGIYNSDYQPYNTLLGALKKLGAPEVIVPFPERVVRLPVPVWVGVYSDDGYASATSEQVFESEARELARSFINELKLFDGGQDDFRADYVCSECRGNSVAWSGETQCPTCEWAGRYDSEGIPDPYETVYFTANSNEEAAKRARELCPDHTILHGICDSRGNSLDF